MKPTLKKIGRFSLALYLIFTLFVPVIPSFLQKVFAETSELQEVFQNELVKVEYQSAVDQKEQEIHWQVWIEKQASPEKNQIGLQFDHKQLGELQNVQLPDEYHYDDKKADFFENTPNNEAKSYQLTFTTAIKEKQTDYQLGLRLYGTKQTEAATEIIDFGAGSSELILQAALPAENSEPAKAAPEAKQTFFDLTGKTANNPLTAHKFLILLPGSSEFVDYDAENPEHALADQSQVQLKYEFDIERFLADPQTSQEFKDLVTAGRKNHVENHNTEFQYEFSFEVDGRLQLDDSGKAGPFKITRGSQEFGYFEISATKDPNYHQVKVTLTTEAFIHSNVHGEFHYNCELALDGSGDPLVVFKKEDQIVEVPIRETNLLFHLEKSAVNIGKYDSHLAATPVQWQVTVTPEENAILKDLKIKDLDWTKPTSWGSGGGGFQFPTAQERKYLKETLELDPDFYVKVGDTILKEGQDYRVYFSDQRKHNLDIELLGTYKAGVSEKVIIGLTTLPLKTHPSELRNKVTAETSNAGDLTTEASVTVNEEALHKSGTYLGNGKIEWLIHYQREGSHQADLTFEDILQGGNIDFSTVEVTDETGAKLDQKYWHLDEKSDQKGFYLTFAAELSAGCYQIKYSSQTAENETAEYAVNEIKSQGDHGLSGREQVPLEGVVVKKKTLAASAYSKYNLWEIEINSKAQDNGYLTIRDGNKSDGLHYFYDPDFTYEQAKADWQDPVKKAAIIEEYGKNAWGGSLADTVDRYYWLKKGIAAYYETTNDSGKKEWTWIPSEDIEGLKVRNNTNQTTDAGLESQSGAWSGQKAGFEFKLSAKKYAGKKLKIGLATKFGNTEIIKPQTSGDKYTNAVEVFLGKSQSTSEAHEWFSDKNIGKRIIKKGELTNDGHVNWRILANFLMHPLKKGDTITDKLNCGTDGKYDPNNDFLNLSEADFEKLKVYTIDTTKKADPDGKEKEAPFLNRKIIKELKRNEDYQINRAADGKSFTLTFLKDQGLYGIGVEFASDYDLTKETQQNQNAASELKLKNYAEEILSGYHNKSTAEIAVTSKNGLATKTANEFTESDSSGKAATLNWSLVFNTAAKKMKNIVISDTPDASQIIDLASVKVYKAKLDQKGHYVPDQTQELGQEITGSVMRIDETDLRGFQLIFDPDFELNYPIVVEYTAQITSASATHVRNNANINWGEEESGTVQEMIKIRDGGGGAEGSDYTIALKKSDQNDQPLAEVAFELEYQTAADPAKWEATATKKTNLHGEVVFTELYSGTYRIKEKIPTGYVGYDGWVYFSFKEGQAVVLTNDKTNETQDLADFYQLGQTGEKDLIVLLVKNQRNKGALPATGGSGNPQILPWVLLTFSCALGVAFYLRRSEGGELS